MTICIRLLIMIDDLFQITNNDWWFVSGITDNSDSVRYCIRFHIIINVIDFKSIFLVSWLIQTLNLLYKIQWYMCVTMCLTWSPWRCVMNIRESLPGFTTLFINCVWLPSPQSNIQQPWVSKWKYMIKKTVIQ